MKADKFPNDRFPVVLFAIFFLFFFQLISDFIEAIYAFGLLGTSIPPEIVSVAFLFSPALLVVFRRGVPKWLVPVTVYAVLVCRVAGVMLDTRGKMLVAGLGIGAFFLFLPSVFLERGEGDHKPWGVGMGISLALAVAAATLLRAVNSGVDFSTTPRGQVIGWGLAIIAGVLLWRHPSNEREPAGGAAGSGRRGWLPLLSLGIMAELLLLYFSFTSPNVIARWTGQSYLLILLVEMVALTVFVFLLANGQRLWERLNRRALLLWNAAFVLSLTLTILPYQVRFPEAAGAYPVAEPQVSALWGLALVIMLATFPILFVNFAVYSSELAKQPLTPGKLAGAFSWAALFGLLMIFGQVFTTVYDYIPVVGPFFRDKFWLVFLLLGVTGMLPLLAPIDWGRRFDSGRKALSPGGAILLGMGLLAIGSITGLWWTSARPDPAPPATTALRIMTYNIQQGYNEAGLKNFDGQLELIRETAPDVLGLQESDTNRIAGGNADLVRYFADRLDMYSYYGPKTVPGTFGIALLSRYPIRNPRTFYFYSAGEQTAAISAQIQVGGKTLNVYVTHLGNGGPIVQQEQFLTIIRGHSNVVAMGDFNFHPDSEQYRLTTTMLADAWLAYQTRGADNPNQEPEKRIDHIFLSPGMPVLESHFITRPESDHPALVTEIGIE